MTLSRALPAEAPTKRIAMWRPTADIEWPGHRGISIDLWGCSFDCGYCATGSIKGPVPSTASWPEIVGAIEARRSFLDGVVVTGGEPTEDPDLPSLLAALCELDVQVRLETNGSRPEMLSLILAEALCHSVALDIKAVPARYREICVERNAASRVAESVDLVLDSGIEHEFRTTVAPELVELDQLPRIARILRGGAIYVLQQCVPCSGSIHRPYAMDELRSAAAACSRFVPTIVRGSDRVTT